MSQQLSKAIILHTSGVQYLEPFDIAGEGMGIRIQDFKEFKERVSPCIGKPGA